MNKIKTTAAIIALITTPGLSASELVYEPINPTFGGNPLNGSYFFTKAKAQNNHSENDARDFVTRFKQSLERNIMSKITRDFANKELKEGTFDAGDYTITVADLGGGRFQVTILNELTGETTVIDMINPGY
ncbi:curli production assembly protein CsgF [Parashewanella curva]|uniref:Curli production assembly/transport component CsgF n=1 Tax=Parashewanella curva TaxID=2338552 RepID=A0A3L8PZI3_9GAMM|nr:curli assembly protein CsgF [Parashewanella curva]RLV60560.1 curli production assembly protein CsgF [Parashewanella curva]